MRIAFGALPQGIAAGSPATVKLIDDDSTSGGSIFDTVLTVGNSGQGCSDSSNYECSEGLGAHTFTSTDSQGVARTFTIRGLSVGTVTSGENRGNRNLWFWVSPDKLFRDYENHRLVLVLDGRRFPFRTSDSAANSRRVKVWEDTGLTWSQGRTVRVEILDLLNAAPNATPNRGHPWFAVADAEANEADGYIDFTVKLRRPTVDGSPLLIGAEVDYTTVDGTAVAGEDYTHTTGTLTFGEDQEKATVRVPLINDAVEDDGETFTLLLSNPKKATIADGEATGTIRNTEGLTASFENVPESHAGSGEFTLRLAFSEALAAGGAGRKIGQALVLTGATRGTVLRVDGRRDLYEFKVRPSGGGAVTVSLPATTGACDASDAICTAGGDKLSGAVSAEIAGPDTGQEPQDSLTASFEDVPESHDGSSAFTLRVAFSEAVSTGFRTMRDDAFTVTGGSVNRAKRVDGASDLWEIRVEPSGSGAVTVSLPATTGACTATGAVCTSGGRKLSGAVSAEIAGPPETPATTLTAEFANVPSEHDGSSAFEVRVLFSEVLAGGGSGRRIAQSLALSGATRGDVRRVDGRRDLYRFQVRPSGNGAVTVSLASTGACGSATAVCTSDGRALSNVPEATIQGPPSIAVQDAEVDEGPNAALAFTVTLSRAASGTVTVDYATSDVTATAGDDYTATSGTLTFAVGETEKAVSVAVLDDAHDDGGETLRLTLSNPSGAWLSDATATGTIRNDDPMLSAWLARFGRTVAEQVVDAVESRIRSAPHPGAEVTLAGQRIDLGPQAGTGAAAEEAREAPAWLADVSRRLQSESGAANDRLPGARAVTPREILTGSSFALTAKADGTGGGVASLWGRGAVTRFDGREGADTVSGDVTSVMLGADWTRERWTAGLMLTHSRGEGSYRGTSEGDLSSAVTGLYPYGRYALNDRVTVWGVAGYGAGTLTLTPERGEPYETDMDLAMTAAGLRGVVVTAEGGPELAVTSDAMAVRTTSEEIRGAPGGNGHLAAETADATRLRLGLEGTWRDLEAGSGTLTPRLEVAVRHDGGDAETGFGIDLGGGLAWSDPESGLRAEVSGRGLLTHESAGFRQRGLAGSLGWDPAPNSARGPSLTLSQTLGVSARGGADALLGRTTLEGLAANDDEDEFDRRRLELKFGYGLAALGGGFTSTPEFGVGLADAGREFSLGWRLARDLRPGDIGSLELLLEGRRQEGVNDDRQPRHSVGFRLTVRW